MWMISDYHENFFLMRAICNSYFVQWSRDTPVYGTRIPDTPLIEAHKNNQFAYPTSRLPSD